jgi:hypothetical protein
MYEYCYALEHIATGDDITTQCDVLSLTLGKFAEVVSTWPQVGLVM